MRVGGNIKKNYGPSATIPNRFFGLFSLDHEEIKLFVDRRLKKKTTHLPFCYSISLNNKDNVIIGGGVISRPLQFPLGKLPIMANIIEKQGSG
jgi:hypothetical protein